MDEIIKELIADCELEPWIMKRIAFAGDHPCAVGFILRFGTRYKDREKAMRDMMENRRPNPITRAQEWIKTLSDEALDRLEFDLMGDGIAVMAQLDRLPYIIEHCSLDIAQGAAWCLCLERDEIESGCMVLRAAGRVRRHEEIPEGLDHTARDYAIYFERLGDFYDDALHEAALSKPGIWWGPPMLM